MQLKHLTYGLLIMQQIKILDYLGQFEPAIQWQAYSIFLFISVSL